MHPATHARMPMHTRTRAHMRVHTCTHVHTKTQLHAFLFCSVDVPVSTWAFLSILKTSRNPWLAAPLSSLLRFISSYMGCPKSPRQWSATVRGALNIIRISSPSQTSG